MLIRNNELVTSLREQLSAQKHFIVHELETLPADSLNFKAEKSGWSALQCLEHLNMVFDIYLPQIRRKLSSNKIKSANSYSTGFFGDRMVSSMEPKNGSIKYPMKTFRNMDPVRSKRVKEEIVQVFKSHLSELENMIDRSEDLDLGSIRIKSAIGYILRFKLGDCYRFLLAHNERHLLQCRKILRVLATYQ